MILTTPAALVAATPPPEGPQLDPDRVTPGLLGFLALLFLVATVVIIYRSLRKQLAKVPPSFDDPPVVEDEAAPTESDPGRT